MVVVSAALGRVGRGSLHWMVYHSIVLAINSLYNSVNNTVKIQFPKRERIMRYSMFMTVVLLGLTACGRVERKAEPSPGGPDPIVGRHYVADGMGAGLAGYVAYEFKSASEVVETMVHEGGNPLAVDVSYRVVGRELRLRDRADSPERVAGSFSEDWETLKVAGLTKNASVGHELRFWPIASRAAGRSYRCPAGPRKWGEPTGSPQFGEPFTVSFDSSGEFNAAYDSGRDVFVPVSTAQSIPVSVFEWAGGLFTVRTPVTASIVMIDQLVLSEDLSSLQVVGGAKCESVAAP